MTNTVFKKVKDNAKGYADSSSLNNTTDPVTFSATSYGFKFPSNGSFWITVYNDVSYSSPDDDLNMEKMLVTSRTLDSFTASRGQLGTTAVAHTGTPVITLLMLAQHLDDITTAVNTLETISGNGITESTAIAYSLALS